MQADPAFEQALKAAIDSKTKPQGALGRIEALAAQIARLQGALRPRMDACRLLIFMGDHGIAAHGVSAFPQAVTRQMAHNFLDGGAAATVFARQFGVATAIVDCGVAGGSLGRAGLIEARQGEGAGDSLTGPAMSEAGLQAAMAAGAALAQEGDWDALCLGEMGIANTSAAALVAAKICGRPVAELVGAGTGLDADGLARKAAILARAAARTPDMLPPAEALRQYGGFEIAAMAGAMIAGAQARRLILVDGFIAGAAAMAALGMAPEIRPALVFAHRSAERGHGEMLGLLQAEPLLDLGLRLGEGTGALLAWPLAQAAAAMLCEMATFEAAGVSGRA